MSFKIDQYFFVMNDHMVMNSRSMKIYSTISRGEEYQSYEYNFRISKSEIEMKRMNSCDNLRHMAPATHRNDP